MKVDFCAKLATLLAIAPLLTGCEEEKRTPGPWCVVVINNWLSVPISYRYQWDLNGYEWGTVMNLKPGRSTRHCVEFDRSARDRVYFQAEIGPGMQVPIELKRFYLTCTLTEAEGDLTTTDAHSYSFIQSEAVTMTSDIGSEPLRYSWEPRRGRMNIQYPHIMPESLRFKGPMPNRDIPEPEVPAMHPCEELHAPTLPSRLW